MVDENYQSEVRASIIRELIEKVKKQNYFQYLSSVRLERIRFFLGAEVRFDFPVTALIGPNGSGKSTILGATALAYSSIKPENFFMKSRIGDKSMDDWQINYEIIDKNINTRGTLKTQSKYKSNIWASDYKAQREIRFFSINRTVPAAENPSFSHKKRLRFTGNDEVDNDSNITFSTTIIEEFEQVKLEAEKILGKSLEFFQLLQINIVRKKIKTKKSKKVESFEIQSDGTKIPVFRREVQEIKEIKSEKLLFVGSNGEDEYSEFNFGAGEASVIRLVADAELVPDYSLILIEEIENGLHPVAVRRLVEYFIDVAYRKKLQVIFTTHSDFALSPLPSEAIWASLDGKVQQGKLSIELLRAVSGRVDKKLAVFVEDEFAKVWVESILREKLGENFGEVGIYPVSGDGNAVKTHLAQSTNPAINFHSICIVDGDSQQSENIEKKNL